MKGRFWNHAEVIDSSGTLSLEINGCDFVHVRRVERSAVALEVCAYCGHGEKYHPIEGCETFRKIEDLSDGEYQQWINVIAAAAKMVEELHSAKKALEWHHLGIIPNGAEIARITMEEYTKNVLLGIDEVEQMLRECVPERG